MTIEELKILLKKYERALEEEVWSSKLGKFVQFKDMPNVKKILEEPLSEKTEENRKE